jgi:hypothetical protein
MLGFAKVPTEEEIFRDYAIKAPFIDSTVYQCELTKVSLTTNQQFTFKCADKEWRLTAKVESPCVRDKVDLQIRLEPDLRFDACALVGMIVQNLEMGTIIKQQGKRS